MKYPVTEYDKQLLLQSNLQYKIKITVSNAAGSIVDVLSGIAAVGSNVIDAQSNYRRTFQLTLKPDDFIQNIEAKIAGWIGLYYALEVGILDSRTDTCQYYPCGIYLITDTSTVYDSMNHTISFDLSDKMSELDGTRNGQAGGAPIIEIPREIEGKKQTIRNTTINLLSSSTNIHNYIISDIGEYYGMSEHNPDFLEYRRINEDWNVLPYDLTYSSGDCISTMLFDIRDFYPNCQMYFDVYDNFCFDAIPSLESDIPDLNYNYIQKILLAENSESVSYEIQSIKNVTEVFGKNYEIDRFCQVSSYDGNVYRLTLEHYNAYQRYHMIAFTPTASNGPNPRLQINALAELPIYYEFTQAYVEPSALAANETCVIMLGRTEGSYIAYYLGQYQPHALCVLTNNANDSVFSKKYFSKKYNVKEKNIAFREEPYSKFSVQQLGEILDSKSGNDFDNILSDSNALQNAKYFNRLSSTMFDTVTITTVLIPWLDVNVKVNYRKARENIVYSYIVQRCENDFGSNTSTITMYRFMQLYE